MYKVLYRRYRPRSFDDVIDQEPIVVTLRNEIRFKRVAHAYLFVGSKGTGKTSCAKILAKTVNCLNPKDGDACLKCESCSEIESGVSLDVTELDAASNNSVNDIRSICENSNFAPVKSKYRIYIIDEIHMLSQGAFAALLKTLEEPVSHVVFVLATTEVHKLPATILSRCQRFLFKRISLESISKRLLDISYKEKIDLSKEAALLLARHSDGALRDALSLMEKLLSSKGKITEEVAGNLIGIASKETVYEIANCIVKKDFSEGVKILSDLWISSKNLSKVLEDIIEIFKNALILKSTVDISFLHLTEDEEKRTRYISLSLSSDNILSILDLLKESFSNLAKRSNSKLELELSIIKACSLTLSSIEDRYDHKGAFEEIKEKKELFSKEATIQTKEAEISDVWPEILKELSFESKVVSVSLLGSKAVDEHGDIVIKTKNIVAKNFLKDQYLIKKILDLAKKYTGKVFKNVSLKEEINDKTVENFVKRAKKQGIEVIEKGDLI